MFDFLKYKDNYDQKKIARDEWDFGYLSTVRVSDGRKPIETALSHPLYNDGNLIIVDCYDTEEEALVGHNAWKEKIVNNNIPDAIVDCCNSELSRVSSEMFEDYNTVFERKKEDKDGCK